MTKPRKRQPQNTLFFHPSEGFCQGQKAWIEKNLKISYPLYLGFLESHTLLYQLRGVSILSEIFSKATLKSFYTQS